MRTPDIFDGYTDEQRQSIKEIVARLQVDADTTEVGLPKQKLFDKLEDLASSYVKMATLRRLRQPPTAGQDTRSHLYNWMMQTPSHSLKQLREAAAAVQKARSHLFNVQMYLWPNQKNAVSLLKEIDDDLQSRIKAATALAQSRGRPGKNASKVSRNAYLGELEKIWIELAGAQRPQRKLKADFLLACAEPPFPVSKHDFGINAGVVKHFLDTRPK